MPGGDVNRHHQFTTTMLPTLQWLTVPGSEKRAGLLTCHATLDDPDLAELIAKMEQTVRAWPTTHSHTHSVSLG